MMLNFPAGKHGDDGKDHLQVNMEMIVKIISSFHRLVSYPSLALPG